MTRRYCFGLLWFCLGWLLAGASLAQTAARTDAGNRLTYLDDSDPFYPNKDFPKLITPQWVGEEGVDAVVILAIDDMRDSALYEKHLRPILNRLKKIDGRAPVSIMANVVKPEDPQLQAWLKEGLSLEVHTLAHPCPLLAKGNFTNAWNTYHGGVDLLGKVPGNHPVAFRMPCCDSMDSTSPRFYAEIFNHASPDHHYLSIDSSVMCLLTEASGAGNRFRKYFPMATNAPGKKAYGNYAAYIEDYPYPYVINGVCWEFPAMVPSDWEAFNLHGSMNPITLADWKAALDVVVKKQGVFSWIFHPHGWSSPEQINEFIDYATSKYGKRVKFLTFKEALERLNKNLLEGESFWASAGAGRRTSLVDVNNDGVMDVVMRKGATYAMRVWNAADGKWKSGNLLPHPETLPLLFSNETSGQFMKGLSAVEGDILSELHGTNAGVRLRDLDHDGVAELIVANSRQQVVFGWDAEAKMWKKLPDGTWPQGVAIVNEKGEDNGVRFVDVNGDGYEDLVYSNEKEYALYLYIAVPKKNLGWEKGFTFKAREGKRGADGLANEIPPIVRAGPHRNNGVWFKNGFMWIQNEDTAHLPDVVQKVGFAELLTGSEQKPKSPTEALAAFQVRPGFKVELVASEPLVMDPVAFDWGADGRLWVVEMADYPLGMDGKGKAGGRIVYLTDTDGDGKYDKRTVFMDGVNFPNGIMPWRKGVLVSAAPDIFYAEDTDGDGKADLKKVLFTGFREGNQQHRINGFEYGLDNWVYAANGDSGGQIWSSGVVERWSDGKWTATTNDAVIARAIPQSKPIDIRGYDIRFKPDTGEIDLVAGQTQFGRHRDDWGNWFGNNNPTWLWHYHVPIEYLKRNPNLVVKSTRTVLANYNPPNQVFTIGKPQQRFNWADRVAQVTSANSACPYRDDLFGPDFATSVFASEPANNVVHREVLEPDGVTFKSHRAPDEQNREFLASSDNWFRPTMLKTGPDGALYIADMYRLILEHPEYFPEEMKSRPDIRAGDDKGRIWRVYPEGATLRKTPRLDQLSLTNLIAAMDSPNGWQRDTVQRLLLEQSKDAIQADKGFDLFNLISAKNPKVRVQALWTANALGFTRAFVHASPILTLDYANLGDEHPGVAAQAAKVVPLSELSRAVRHDAIQVRYIAAFRLAEVTNSVEAGSLLAELAVRDFNDANMRVAILSSAAKHLDSTLEHLLALATVSHNATNNIEDAVGDLLGLAVAQNDFAAVKKTLAFTTGLRNGEGGRWQFGVVGGFLNALDRKNTTLEKFSNQGDDSLKSEVNKLGNLFAKARQLAGDNNASIENRTAAIPLLGREQREQQADLKQLRSLLGPQATQPIQQAAFDTLKKMRMPEVGNALLTGWKTYGPAMRTEVLNTLLSRAEWTQALVEAVEAGTISARELGTIARQKLLTSNQPAIRARAEKLFAVTNTDRQAVLKQYAGVPELKGDAIKGAAVFGANCTTCHQFKGQGTKLGPDLGSMADKTPQSLLTAILDPNAAIDAGYTAYTVTTKDERDLVGLIVVESPTSLTIRMPGGAEETVLRSQVKEFRANTLSLMPEGLEAALKPQDMADLIAYLLK